MIQQLNLAAKDDAAKGDDDDADPQGDQEGQGPQAGQEGLQGHPPEEAVWFLSVGLDRRKFPRFRCASVPVKIGSPASPHPSNSMTSPMVFSGCDSHCGRPCVALVGVAHTNHTHNTHTHTQQMNAQFCIVECANYSNRLWAFRLWP